MRRLESKPTYGMPAGILDEMARALFVCHDLGKLSVTWQDWAHRWQRQLGRFYGGRDMSLPPDYMAAHTDYEPTDEQKAAQRQLGKRPNHAGEGAMAAVNLLWTLSRENRPLLRAGVTAIARHHNASTDRYQAYKSHRSASQAFSELWKSLDCHLSLLTTLVGSRWRGRSFRAARALPRDECSRSIALPDPGENSTLGRSALAARSWRMRWIWRISM